MDERDLYCKTQAWTEVTRLEKMVNSDSRPCKARLAILLSWMLCQEPACMVTYSVWLFLHLAWACSPEPAVHLAHSHFQQPATVQQKVITHQVPMPQQQYKGMLAWLQRTGRTTNKRAKYTDRMAETFTCNPPHAFIAGYGKQVVSSIVTKFHQAQHTGAK